MHKTGFLHGYLEKQAIIGELVTIGGEAASNLFDQSKFMALAAPSLLGAGAGVLASKLTSPSGTDTENLQKALLAAELEQSLSEVRRRQLVEHMKEKRKRKDAKQRELHL